jgi:hypothetical protein
MSLLEDVRRKHVGTDDEQHLVSEVNQDPVTNVYVMTYQPCNDVPSSGGKGQCMKR